MPNLEKPYKGRIAECVKIRVDGGAFAYSCYFLDHPEFAGKYGHTSIVLSENTHTGDVETLNSRYTIVGDGSNQEA